MNLKEVEENINKFFLFKPRNRRLGFLLLFLVFGVVFLVNLFFLLKIPPVWPDEALIADSALNFLEKGSLGTNIFGGTMPGAERFGVSYPPLYFLVSSLAFKVMGFSAFSLRLISLTLGFFFLFVFWKVISSLVEVKRWSGFLKLSIIIGFILLLIDEAIIKAFHIGRPEILVALLGFVAIYFYLKTFQGKKTNIYFLIIGSLLGLAFLAHYLAIIFIFSIGLHILITNFRDFYRSSWFYFFVAGVLLSIGFWIVWDPQMFMYNINNFFLRVTYRTNSPNWLWLVLSGAALPAKIVYIFYIFTLWELLKGVLNNRDDRNVLVLLLLSFSWLAAYLWQTFYGYVFVAIFSYLAIVYLVIVNEVKGRVYASILGILFILNVWNLFGLVLQNKGNNFSYHDYSYSIAEIIPEGSSVYLSALPDPYFALKETNEVYEFPVLPTSKEDLEEVLNKVDYIVINNSLEVIVAGDVVAPYIRNNAEEIKDIGGLNQYHVSVIKLKPRDLRENGE